MSAVDLLTPILNGGIQNINFVNGTVLDGRELTGERKATLQRQRLIGKCVGDGVAIWVGSDAIIQFCSLRTTGGARNRRRS